MSLENNWFDVYFKLYNVSIIDNKFKTYFVDLEPYFQIGRETSFKVGDITEQQMKEVLLDKVYEYEI